MCGGPMQNYSGAIAELLEKGFCVLPGQLAHERIEACRLAFWPVLMDVLTRREANRGPHRFYLPMPFEPPCFAPEFFFDPGVLTVVRGTMDERVVADQWGCDVPVRGSVHQEPHVDFRRPLFAEAPALVLPPYMLVVSFGLVPIRTENGPIEIAAGDGRMQRVLLDVGDVLIRHPWALHRGTPNLTDVPRPLVSIRYVRRWYWDDSREVNAIPTAVWRGLTAEEQAVLRFPVCR